MATQSQTAKDDWCDSTPGPSSFLKQKCFFSENQKKTQLWIIFEKTLRTHKIANLETNRTDQPTNSWNTSNILLLPIWLVCEFALLHKTSDDA